ncbi:MAG: hypothetical protein OHK0024_12170 [Thalassobaculales bacterium]
MPADAAGLIRRGIAAARRGLNREAARAFLAAAAAVPRATPALVNLARLPGCPVPVTALLRRAARHAPGLPGPHDLLAKEALDRGGDPRRARQRLRLSAALAPGDAGLLYNLALAEMRCPAILSAPSRLVRRSLRLRPGHAAAWTTLGTLYEGKGDRSAAARCYMVATALALAPPAAFANLAGILQRRGKEQAAIRLYRLALTLAPGDPGIRANLSAAFFEAGMMDEALDQAEAILQVDPGNRGALWTRSWVYLLRTDLEEGFRHYDVAWRQPNAAQRGPRLAPALWDGRPLPAGGKLVLWGESGVGDEVLGAGLVTEAAARAAGPVILECDPRFAGLFQRSFPGLEVAARASPAEPVASVQCSTLRLPLLFRRRKADFPAHRGYLVPDPARVAEYRARFDALGRPAVGLAWASSNPQTGGRKSIRLLDWGPLLAQRAIQFVSLQYGAVAEEIAALHRLGVGNLHPNPGPDVFQDLDGLAAQIAALDAVVSIAGVNAHLAGALNRPAVVVVPYAPLWFWFDRGGRSPWYPSLRLVRQSHPTAGFAEAVRLATRRLVSLF